MRTALCSKCGKFEKVGNNGRFLKHLKSYTSNKKCSGSGKKP